MDKFKSGFVSLIGKANVGKSTLINNILEEKISIVSNKPQTTRNKIYGILNKNNLQIIFIDTPGIHKPKNKLSNFMIKSAENSLKEIDIVLFLIEPRLQIDILNKNIIEKLKKFNNNVFLIINKIDKINKEDLLKIIDNYRLLYNFKEIIPISAIKRENIDLLINKIEQNLNIGPKYFPGDIVTDQSQKQIISEIIREKILFLLKEEIPHGILVEVNKIENRKNKNIIDIQVIIYIEKNSHKSIIIGKNGILLKKIGILSRKDIEKFLNSKIYLNLWVKIKRNWRDNDIFLKNFGYNSKNI